MNKKAYITPAMEVMTIDTVEMMAASPSFNLKEDGGDDSSLSNDRRGSWGNLWNNE